MRGTFLSSSALLVEAEHWKHIIKSSQADYNNGTLVCMRGCIYLPILRFWRQDKKVAMKSSGVNGAYARVSHHVNENYFIYMNKPCFLVVYLLDMEINLCWFPTLVLEINIVVYLFQMQPQTASQLSEVFGDIE